MPNLADSVASTHALSKPLTSFPIFPNFPLEIREMIWRAAMPPPWIFFAEVRVQHDDDDDDDEHDIYSDFSEGYDIYDHYPKGEHVQAIEAIDRELDVLLDSLELFSKTHQGQTQLERYGFSSSRPKPKIRKTEMQLRGEHFRTRIAAKRTGYVQSLESNYKIPVLLHTCRESRDVLQLSGYGLVFSTYTSAARVWFNFKTDILVIRAMDEDDVQEVGLVNGGTYNFGQCPQAELEQVRRLALWSSDSYIYGKSVSEQIHEAVQTFRKLEELLVIDMDWYTFNWRREEFELVGLDPVIVDVGVEERWGHFLHWNTNKRSSDILPGPLYLTGEGVGKPLDAVIRDFETQFRTHAPVVHEMMDSEQVNTEATWSTPKVRFVILMSQEEEKGFMERRTKFRAHLEEMYIRKLGRARGPPDPSINPTNSALSGCDLAWYAAARKQLNPNAECPSPFTMEAAEAREAVEDMDSWAGF